MLWGMEQKDTLGELAGQRLTAVRIGEILGVTEKTARKRLADGLPADDVIAISRGLGVNPTTALIELGYLTLAEVMDSVDADGKLLATADDLDLVFELADRTLTASHLTALLGRRVQQDAYDLAARHGEKGVPDYIAPGEEPQVHPDDD